MYVIVRYLCYIYEGMCEVHYGLKYEKKIDSEYYYQNNFAEKTKVNFTLAAPENLPFVLRLFLPSF